MKGNPKVNIQPADLNILQTFINLNASKLPEHSPFLTRLCLPGLTEEFKLQVLLYAEQYSLLKTVFVAEEISSELKEEL